MTKTTTPLSRETSDAIRIARVLCIMFMISVHFWPGARAILEGDVPAWLHGFYMVVVEYLGRGSVPLLSTVSGVLLTISARRRDVPLGLLPGKARVFLVPMVVWSAVMVALAVVNAVLLGDASELPQGAMGWVNAFFALTAPPANLPLAFLRDVFVATAIGLLAIGIHRRAPAAGVLLLVVAALVEGMTGGIVLLRPQILSFFVLGILMSWAGAANFVPRWWLVLGMLALDVLLQVFPQLAPGVAGEFAHSYLNRIAMMLLMWRVAVEVVRQGGTIHRAIARLEPYVFTIFCTHVIMVSAVAVLAGRAGLRVEDPIYPLVFLAQFPLSVLFAVAVATARRRVLPKLAMQR